MEGRAFSDRGDGSSRNARGTSARLGRNKTTNVAGLASSRLHHWRDGGAGFRQTNRECSRIFDSAGCEWQRRDLFRAVRCAKRNKFEVELARPWFSRRFFAGGPLGACGRLRCKVESFLLRPRLSPTLDKPDR